MKTKGKRQKAKLGKAKLKKAALANKFCLLPFTFCLLIFLFAFQSQAQTYVNPVIPGDFPDPSVIRVGEDYYATATTGGWSPHFPLLRSKDLINWEIIGAVFGAKPAWA